MFDYMAESNNTTSFRQLSSRHAHQLAVEKSFVAAKPPAAGSKRNNLGKREFLPAVPGDGQYVLARAESD